MNWIKKYWAWLTDNNSFECISNVLGADNFGNPVCKELFRHKTKGWEIEKVSRL